MDVPEIISALVAQNGGRIKEAEEQIQQISFTDPETFFRCFFSEAVNGSAMQAKACLTVTYRQLIQWTKIKRAGMAQFMPVVIEGFQNLIPKILTLDGSCQNTFSCFAIVIWRIMRYDWPLWELVDHMAQDQGGDHIVASILVNLSEQEVAQQMPRFMDHIVRCLQSQNFEVRLEVCQSITEKLRWFQEGDVAERIIPGIVNTVIAAEGIDAVAVIKIWKAIYDLPCQYSGDLFNRAKTIMQEIKVDDQTFELFFTLYDFVAYHLQLEPDPNFMDQLARLYIDIQKKNVDSGQSFDGDLSSVFAQVRHLGDDMRKTFVATWLGNLQQMLQPSEKATDQLVALRTLCVFFQDCNPYLDEDVGPFFFHIFCAGIQFGDDDTAKAVAEMFLVLASTPLRDRLDYETLFNFLSEVSCIKEGLDAIVDLLEWVCAVWPISPAELFLRLRERENAFIEARKESVYFRLLSETVSRFMCEIPERVILELRSKLAELLQSAPNPFAAALFVQITDCLPQLGVPDEVTTKQLSDCFGICIQASESDEHDFGLCPLSQLIHRHMKSVDRNTYLELYPFYEKFIMTVRSSPNPALYEWEIVGLILKMEKDPAVIKLEWVKRVIALARDSCPRSPNDVNGILRMIIVFSGVSRFAWRCQPVELAWRMLDKLMEVARFGAHQLIQCIWRFIKPSRVKSWPEAEKEARIKRYIEILEQAVSPYIDRQRLGMEEGLLIGNILFIFAVYHPDGFANLWERLKQCQDAFPMFYPCICEDVIMAVIQKVSEISEPIWNEFLMFIGTRYSQKGDDNVVRMNCHLFYVAYLESHGSMTLDLDVARLLGEFSQTGEFSAGILLLQIARFHQPFLEAVLPVMQMIQNTFNNPIADTLVKRAIGVLIGFVEAYSGRFLEFERAVFRLFARWILFTPRGLLKSLCGDQGPRMQKWIAERCGNGEFWSLIEEFQAENPMRVEYLRAIVSQS